MEILLEAFFLGSCIDARQAGRRRNTELPDLFMNAHYAQLPVAKHSFDGALNRLADA